MKFFGEGFWENRLQTDPEDAELLMRHEMQQSCPDLLIHELLDARVHALASN